MSSTLDSDTDTGSLSDADPDFDGSAIPTDAPSRGVRWSSRPEGESRGRHLRFSETPKRSARRDRASPPEAPPPTECETIARAHARLQPRVPDDAFAMRTDEGAPVSSQGDEPHLQPTGIVRKKRPRGRPRRETTPTPPSKKRKPYDPHKDLRLGRFFRFRVDASGEPGRDDADPPRWVHGITSHRINARGEHNGKYWVLRDPERGEYDTHEQGWAATLAQDDDARFPEPLDVARLERDGLLEYVDLHFFPHPTTPDARSNPNPRRKRTAATTTARVRIARSARMTTTTAIRTDQRMSSWMPSRVPSRVPFASAPFPTRRMTTTPSRLWRARRRPPAHRPPRRNEHPNDVLRR